MVGRRGRRSVGKGIIKLDMTLECSLTSKDARKIVNGLKKNVSHLSSACSGHPLARTKTPDVRELPVGVGCGHRIGAGGPSAMGTAGPRRTSSPEGQARAVGRQSQAPQIVAPPNITLRFAHLGQIPCVLNPGIPYATPCALP